MKVIVIPDIHLKPWMFERASKLMKAQKADRAVCLMDIADDWGQQMNMSLYEQTYDAAIAFAREYPDTLWCYGNHDACYLWSQMESGYSILEEGTVCERLRILRESLPDENQLAFLQRIDNVLFCHGGLSEDFVRQFVPPEKYSDVNAVIETINGFGVEEMWKDGSPIWCRPQYGKCPMYKPDELLQVVGHTPTKQIFQMNHLISCDVFSTYQDGSPIGTQEFLILDTITGDFIKEK